MPHISSKKLDDGEFNKIYSDLIHIFELAGKEKEISHLLKKLLTETEKIMLSKRLAVIFMLNEEVPISTIWEVLSMSPSTVCRISMEFESGLYKSIIKFINKNRNSLWNTIEKIIANQITKQSAKGRWKKLNQLIP